MSAIAISLLGPFALHLADAPEPVKMQPKVRALLAYLVTAADRPHERESLAGLLWPEFPQAAARHNLRQALSKLRRVIPPANLHIARQTIQFIPDGCQNDVAIFERQLAQYRRHAHDDPLTCEPCMARLEEAAALYRGDFLAGFTLAESAAFEEWVTLKREWLRREALLALYTLAHHHRQKGDYETAYKYAWRQVAMDSLREESHRQLMLIYAESGQQAAALRQYQVCVDLLKAELDLSPATETMALYEQIRTGTLGKTIQAVVSELDFPSFLADDDLAPPEKPLVVARERELGQLHQMLDLALEGQGRIMFVTGEAGQGKSTLIEAFARQALNKGPGLLVAGGNCEAYSGAGDPYLPFREILSMLAGDIESSLIARTLSHDQAWRVWHRSRDTIQALLDRGPDLIGAFVSLTFLARQARAVAPDGADWARQLEQLAAQQAEHPKYSDHSHQANLFQQYIAVLKAIAQKSPLLLILDDLQWADTGSVDLLFHLGRRLAESRILVLGAYRPADVAVGRAGDRHPLESVLNEFQRRFGRNQLDLHLADNRLLVEAILASEPNRFSPSFSQALYRHTQGHAFFTVETLRAMQERGDLIKDDSGHWIEGQAVRWTQLPAKVEGVIGERLGRLSSELQETLKVACIMGEEFTAEVVALVLKVEAQQIIRQLSGPLNKQHHLVRGQRAQQVNGQRLSTYRFRHNLFQSYLYNSLDNVERVYLHGDVAYILEELYAGQRKQVAVQLARHFEAAGQMQQAVDYLQQAGEHALTISAYTQARTHFEKALHLLETLGGPETTPLFALLHLKLGETLLRLTDLPAARAVLEAGLAEGYRQNDLLLTANALYWAGCLAQVEGNHRQSISYLEEGLALAYRVEDEAVVAQLLSELGNCHWELGNYDQALAYCEESLTLARRIGDTIQELSTLHHLGSIAHSQRNLDRKEQLAKEGLPKAQQIGHRELAGTFLSELALVAWERGNLMEAHDYYQQALSMYQGTGHQTMVAYILGNLADIYVWKNDTTTARRYLHQALSLGRQIEVPWTILSAVLVSGWLLARTGKIQQGLALLGLCLSHPALSKHMKDEIYDVYLADLGLDPQDPTVAAQLEAGKTLVLDKVVETLLDELSVEKGWKRD